jgi:hypothetical protein
MILDKLPRNLNNEIIVKHAGQTKDNEYIEGTISEENIKYLFPFVVNTILLEDDWNIIRNAGDMWEKEWLYWQQSIFN